MDVIVGTWRVGRHLGASGAVFLNCRNSTVHRGGLAATMTPQEFKLVSMALPRPGQIVTKGEIYDAVWGDDPDGGPENLQKSIDVLMFRVRGKLTPLGILLLNRCGRGVEPALEEEKAA